MKWLLFCLAVGVLPASGEPRGAPGFPITLYTQFQQDPPKAVLEALQDELESIMSPMGLHFDWRSLSAPRGSEVSVDHIFANTELHGSWGVGKAAYTVQELLSDDFRFEERESQALRTGKMHAALGNGGTP